MVSLLPCLRPIIITNCTTRKRAPDPPVTLPIGYEREPVSAIAKQWNTLLRNAAQGTLAGDLYVGRAIGVSKRVTRLLDADLYIVSAGLGLVRETDLVPNYDLTVGADAGPLNEALKANGEDSTHWWALRTVRPESAGSLAGLVCSVPDRMVIIALPSSYLQMVADDLGAILSDAAHMLRIFTSEAGKAKVPEHLRHCVLPYDERLESLGGYDGTRAEFPQRALRHFVEALSGHHLALKDAHAAVSASLAGLKKRVTPTRKRVSDAQIASMLREQWELYSGSSTRLHRYLRDKAHIACEQSRFRAIWRQLQSENQGQKGNTHAT